MNTLFARDISFSYINNGKENAWYNFNFSISQGEIVSIIGSSGIGKTTLLRVLSGLHFYKSGSVFINDLKNKVSQPNTPVFVVFQDYNLTLLPWLTIEENIYLGIHKSFNNNKDALISILELLFPNLENYTDFIKSYPDQLSGGQKQRIQIARALISNSDFIFFDEPDTGIDYKHKLTLRNIFINLIKNQNKGIVLITHDLENSFELSDRFYIIHKKESNNAINLIQFNKNEFNNLNEFRETVLKHI